MQEYVMAATTKEMEKDGEPTEKDVENLLKRVGWIRLPSGELKENV